MALTVKHAFVSAISDDPAASAAGEVLPSHWNAGHTITGVADPSQLPIATTLALGAVSPDGTTITITAGGVITAVGGAASLTVGSSAISSGTNTRVLFDNNGTLGEYTISGTGSVAMTTSPSFTTPTLGVATATSINKVALTAPATGSTLTIADGKTLTASNTITLTATDGSTLAIGAGGTLGSAAYQNTGTSGGNVPLLNGANTWSLGQTLSAALTYGGVTLSNSVTGTGSMVLSAGPTLTGTITAAAITASGAIAFTAGTASTSTTTGTLVVTGGAGFSGALNVGTFAKFASGSNYVKVDASNTRVEFFYAGATQNYLTATANAGEVALTAAAGSATFTTDKLIVNTSFTLLAALASRASGSGTVTSAVGTIDLWSATGTASFIAFTEKGVSNNGVIGYDAGSSTFQIRVNGATSFSTGTQGLAIASTGVVTMAHYGAGTATFDASGNISSSSDARLKTVRGAFTRGLPDILKLRSTSILYSWNEESGLDPAGVYGGWTAQDVQKAIPEAVFADSRGFLTLHERPLLAATINALIELSDRVKMLEV